jgi:hypothetical protein
MFKKEGKTKAIGSAQAGRIGKGDGNFMNQRTNRDSSSQNRGRQVSKQVSPNNAQQRSSSQVNLD